MALDVAPLLALLGRYGYVIVFLAGIGEALPLLGFLIPGQAVILVAGAAAAAGHLNLWLVFAAAVPAGIIGDALGYYLGRHQGRGLLEKYAHKLAISDKHIARSDALFARWGVFALILARFSFLTRGIGPLLAGMARMRQRVFWPFNVLGALLWAGGYVLLGYFFGAAYSRVEGAIGRILTVTLLSVAGLYILYRLLRKYADQFTRSDLYVALMGIVGGTVFGLVADRLDKVGRMNRIDALEPALVRGLAPVRDALAWFDPLASYPIAGILALSLLTVFALKRRVWPAALVGIAIGGIFLLIETLRRVFIATLAPQIVSGTFPSANGAIAVVTIGVVVYLVSAGSRGAWPTLAGVLASTLLASGAALAPLARGAESPSDLLGGLALGTVWLSVSLLIVEFGVKRTPTMPEPEDS